MPEPDDKTLYWIIGGAMAAATTLSTIIGQLSKPDTSYIENRVTGYVQEIALKQREVQTKLDRLTQDMAECEGHAEDRDQADTVARKDLDRHLALPHPDAVTLARIRESEYLISKLSEVSQKLETITLKLDERIDKLEAP